MLYFLLSFVFSLLLTVVVRYLSIKFDILDHPDGTRKKHTRPIPLMGGAAIFLSFWFVVFILYLTNKISNDLFSQFTGVFAGSLILMILGYFDDKFGLSAKIRLLFGALAALAVIVGGVGLTGITNPFGGILPLDKIVWHWSGGEFVVLADMLVFFWLLGMMYAVKIFDGLDGLATGIVFIGAMMIFALSTYTIFLQPDIALIALVLAGACFGFLCFNFYPAKIFLGEGGGLFLGFILGVLAVISGSKIATALLVMAVPVFDLARVMLSRFINKQPLFKGDRRHLHFQLLDFGLSEKQTVLILYSFAVLFGITTLFFPSGFKIVTLILLGALMFFFGFYLDKKTKNYGK